MFVWRLEVLQTPWSFHGDPPNFQLQRRTSPDPNSHNRAWPQSNPGSYPDNGAVTKSLPYASASSGSSPPPPIASPFLLFKGQFSRQRDRNARAQGRFQESWGIAF